MNTVISPPIQALINDIQKQDRVDNTLILDIVQAHQLSQNDLAPFALYDHQCSESYGRKLIFDNGNFKLLLMSWRAGDFTAIHNHGYTEWGSISFFGTLTHRLYNASGKDLTLVHKNTFQAGQHITMSGDLTHMMGNSSNENIMTLHIYGSNSRKHNVSEGAKVFMPEQHKTVTTMGSAYLNMAQDYIVNELPLNTMAQDSLEDYLQLVKPFYERNNNADLLNMI